MTNYKFGDVITVMFPQSGVEQRKRRPAVVVLDIGDADIVVAPVTSQSQSRNGDLPVADWAQAGLIKPSWVRLAKVFFVLKQDVGRQFGRLSNTDRSQVASSWEKLYERFVS